MTNNTSRKRPFSPSEVQSADGAATETLSLPHRDQEQQQQQQLHPVASVISLPDALPSLVKSFDVLPIMGVEQVLRARVAKYFGNDLYFGSIGLYYPESSDAASNCGDVGDSNYHNVQYDDGDSEDWDVAETELGKEFCDSHGPKETLDLWQIYHVDPDEIRDQWKTLAHKKAVPPQQWPPRTFVNHASTVVHFYLFLCERQRAWRRRQAFPQHPARWTNDPILRNYSFCNIHRELDRGTSFFHAQILQRWSTFPSKQKLSKELNCKPGAVSSSSGLTEWLVQVLWASYCYRLVNKIESFWGNPLTTNNGEKGADTSTRTTFRGIPTLEKWPEFRQFVVDVRAQGRIFFTGAHQTCGFDRYLDQLEEVYRHPERLARVAAAVASAERLETLRVCFLAISKEMPGCGKFLSWQIVCDLVESNCFAGGIQNHQQQLNDFCVLGKGAKAGIQEIFYPKATSVRNKREAGETDVELTKLLVQHQQTIYKLLKPSGFRLSFPCWQGNLLTLKEMEHTLCEFSKYLRIERAHTKGQTAAGQRLRKSRTALDQRHQCTSCRQKTIVGQPLLLVMCDTCNQGYCQECDTTSSGRVDQLSWVCGQCRALARHDWGRG